MLAVKSSKFTISKDENRWTRTHKLSIAERRDKRQYKEYYK